MRKKNGFTLIELMVVVLIGILLVGGGVTSFNNFRIRQSVEEGKNEILARIKMAKNLAVTRQYKSSINYKYVKVTIGAGGLITAAEDEGGNYFSIDVTGDGVESVMTAADIKFAAGSGKLVKLTGGVVEPIGIADTIAVSVYSTQGVGETKAIIISSSGMIGEE